MTCDEQAARERAIFAEFARASGLRLCMDSIQSRQPHEPDILCDIDGEGPVAFELRKETSEEFHRRHRFLELYEALSPENRAAIEECLGGAPGVFLGFCRDVPVAARRQVPKLILDLLVSCARAAEPEARLREGKIHVWHLPALKELVTRLNVCRSQSRAAFLLGIEMSPAEDRTPYLLTKKFASQYRTEAPIELLAYYARGTVPDDASWRTDVLGLVASQLARSQFRRVWFFDMHAVVLVYPPIPVRIDVVTVSGPSPANHPPT